MMNWINEILQWVAIGYIGWALYQLGQATTRIMDCIEIMEKWKDIEDKENKK